MDEVVLLSKAMADKNRLNIVALIQREEKLCVCELSDTLHLSQPLVSRHLKQLKAADVLESKKEGKWIIYSICERPSRLLEAYLETLKPLADTLDDVITCQTRQS